jgi:hypothetical protein
MVSRVHATVGIPAPAARRRRWGRGTIEAGGAPPADMEFEGLLPSFSGGDTPASLSRRFLATVRVRLICSGVRRACGVVQVCEGPRGHRSGPRPGSIRRGSDLLQPTARLAPLRAPRRHRVGSASRRRPRGRRGAARMRCWRGGSAGRGAWRDSWPRDLAPFFRLASARIADRDGRARRGAGTGHGGIPWLGREQGAGWCERATPDGLNPLS